MYISPKQAEAALNKAVRAVIQNKLSEETDKESYPIKTRKLGLFERRMMEEMNKQFAREGKVVRP